jgi:hypothetical protein
LRWCPQLMHHTLSPVSKNSPPDILDYSLHILYKTMLGGHEEIHYYRF